MAASFLDTLTASVLGDDRWVNTKELCGITKLSKFRISQLVKAGLDGGRQMRIEPSSWIKEKGMYKYRLHACILDMRQTADLAETMRTDASNERNAERRAEEAAEPSLPSPLEMNLPIDSSAMSPSGADRKLDRSEVRSKLENAQMLDRSSAAQLRWMDLQIARGKLVRRDKVASAVTQLAGYIRQRMNLLAGELSLKASNELGVSQRRVHRAARPICDEFLRELAERLSKFNPISDSDGGG